MTLRSARQKLLIASVHVAQSKLYLQQSRALLSPHSASRQIQTVVDELSRVIEPLSAIRQALLLEETNNE